MMKKHLFKLFACTMALVFALSACGDRPSVSQSGTTQTIDTSDGTEPGQVSTNILTPETSPFRLALPCNITIYGSGNDTGFYEIYSNDDFSKNIFYTDYTTQQQVYLCSQPNCAHDNEACTAWLPPCDGQVYPVAIDERVALIYSNPSECSKIEIMNQDGANRHLLVEFDADVAVEPGAAVNDQYLVLKTTSYATDKHGEVHVLPELTAVDLQTGALYTIYKAPDSGAAKPSEPGSISMFFRGVTNSGFIVKTISILPYSIDETMDEDEAFDIAAAAMEHTIYEIPFDGSPVRELLQYRQGEYYEEPFGDSLFFLKNHGEGQYSLEKLNTQTMEHTVIVDDFSRANLQTSISSVPFSDTILSTRVDDFLILNTCVSSTTLSNGNIEVRYACYAVDVNTGEMRELKLSNYFAATELPIYILAQTDNDLLVHAMIEEVKTADNPIPMTQRSLGLISKEDYFHSEPNYRMISSLRRHL